MNTPARYPLVVTNVACPGCSQKVGDNCLYSFPDDKRPESRVCYACILRDQRAPADKVDLAETEGVAPVSK